jgi:hypothetical protein
MLSLHKDEVPTAEKISHWSYLHTILEKLPDFDESLQLGLIIGGNCPKALEPHEVICSVSDGPYASRSPLGWRIIGPIGGNELADTTMGCYRIRFTLPLESSLNEVSSNLHFAEKNSFKEIDISHCLEKMYNMDFPEIRNDKATFSHEDKRFMDLMDSSIYKQDSHYHLPLPFRKVDLTMSNNRNYALKRLQSNKRKMERCDEHK